MTGISDRELLRASHIKPWKDCTNDERLDPDNGLLLSALWDAAFDKGLVAFGDNGRPCFSPVLGEKARSALERPGQRLAGLTAGHRAYLAEHRRRYFKSGK